jgi:hypothetical protein
MTEQEYYDLLVKSATDGTFPSGEIHPIGFNCLYRTRDGRKCAAGLLMSDSDYDRSMEGRDFVDLMDEHPELKECIPKGMNSEIVWQIQGCHDRNAKDKKGWDANEFIKDLNTLPCFDSCKKEKTTNKKKDEAVVFSKV